MLPRYTFLEVCSDRETSDESQCCPVDRCAQLVAGKWTLLVVRDLADGPRHYGDLERSLPGISPRTLADRLKVLAEHGLVSRTYIRAVPPRTMYELTERGRTLLPLIDAMREVGKALER